MRILLSLLLGLALSGNALAQDLSKVFRKVDKAVVVIQTSEEVARPGPPGRKPTKTRGLGTGVIIDEQGTVLTAAHVVDTADAIKVVLVDGRERVARVITTSSIADIALIRMQDPPADLTWVKPGDSSKIETGEQVFVIGTPYGLDHSLTVGHLSGRRIMENTPFGDIEFLQTDAAINQGNSGGPLFSLRGELIGIVSHIKTKSGGSEGLGFAASINMAREILIDDPPVWLGADIVILTEPMAHALNAGQAGGMLVQKVARDSIAGKLGIQAGSLPVKIGDAAILLGGDIIVEVNGTKVLATEQGMAQLVRKFKRVESGDTLAITVIRRGQEIQLSTTVE